MIVRLAEMQVIETPIELADVKVLNVSVVLVPGRRLGHVFVHGRGFLVPGDSQSGMLGQEKWELGT